jgi:hypothetical protein
MSWKIIWVEIMWIEIIWNAIIWVEIIWNVTEPIYPNKAVMHFSASIFMVPYLHQFSTVVLKIYVGTAPSNKLFGTKLVINISIKA